MTTEESDDEIISKTQRKKDMLELQELGKRLVDLPSGVLRGITMPEELREAIEFAQTIKSNGALRRQMQYIGRVMRSVDADEIRVQLRHFELQYKQTDDEHHSLENLRDRLIHAGKQELEELLSKHPDTDQKKLKQLIANARIEDQQQKHGKSYRALFRFLRDELGPTT